MSERRTTIELGTVGGMSDYGRKTPAEMIALYRRYAEYNLAQAQAVLAAPDDATPGPWESTPLGSEGYTVTGAPDPGATGVRAKVRLRIARFGYQDWDTDRANAELVANAPEWLDDLLAEVGLLRTLKHRHEQTITELAARAEAAEQAAQRVRGLAGELRAKHYLAPTATAGAILRALDGGEQP